MLRDYKPQMDTPKRQGRLSLVYLQFTITDGSGTPSLDTANSSPNVAVTRSTTGAYSITMPKGQFQHFVGGGVRGPSDESAGSNVYPEASDADAGTATIETAVTPGTAADPANGSRVLVTYLVGGY